MGASLYACEGTKARVIHRTGQKIFAIEFTNTNPNIIRVFMEFLRLVVQADESRLHPQLFIYPDHDEKQLLGYWSNLTAIPISQFNQTIKLTQKSFKYKPNPLGVLKIRYHCKKHFLEIQSIISQVFEGEVA